MKKLLYIIAAAAVMFYSCGGNEEPVKNNELELKMNEIAEKYVKLVLRVGQHDANYVDAYYGPEEWKPAGDTASIEDLYLDSGELLDSLEALSDYKATELESLRHRYLYKQVMAVRGKIFMLTGDTFSFEDEAKALYDAEPPVHSEEDFQKIIDSLKTELPGSGSLSERLDRFKSGFIIPKEKLDTVFQRAIAECRSRTLEHIRLPQDESFVVEYVTDKPWGGYNWYKGNSYSVIQVNTDLPVYIDRAVDLAAHEGYPGHHVYNLLLEREMVKNRKWMEFSVYPLYSPQSLIAEGSANYGIEVAFPGEERIKFEKEVLFPLAGLNPQDAEKYYRVLDLISGLTYAGNEAARHYLNGDWSREETKSWLVKFALNSPERAEQRLKFIDAYRSYVINYNLGKDIVQDYIERNGGTNDYPQRRWELFEKILSTPQTPSNLK